MSDYWDYFMGVRPGDPFQSMNNWWNLAYNDSHGSARYWLSKVPIFPTLRKWDDEAKQAQDRYDNTGVDEAYIDRVIGFNGAGFNDSLHNVANRAVRMARSLSDVYSPEVVENISSKFNNSYW